MTVEIEMGRSRFDRLLNCKASYATVDYDRPLLDRADWLVAPTLGAIVPNWLLLIPRDRALNFRIWKKLCDRSPDQLLIDLRKHLGLHENEIIWFEHGPLSADTSIGCGLDHAHIHILVRPRFSFEAFVEKARSLSSLDWKTTTSAGAHDRIDADHSYLVAGSGETSIVAQDVEVAGSQFFRRVIGALVDACDAWDYRRHPHVDNIAKTIFTFRALENGALRAE